MLLIFSTQVLVAILSGALWVPYLGSFHVTLILTTVATFILALIITKIGPVRFECRLIGYSPPFCISTNLFLGTSLVLRPQKALACQEKPARVLSPVSSLALVPLRSGCLSICLPNLTIVTVVLWLTLVLTSMETTGSGTSTSDNKRCQRKIGLRLP